MGIFLPGRRVKPRRFDYEPRYYNPKKDDDIKRRMRVQGRSRRRSPVSAFYMAMLLLLAFWIYTKIL